MAGPKAQRPAWGAARIECSRRKCGWTGTEKDLVGVPNKKIKGSIQHVCPKCGCDSYYFASEAQRPKR